MIALLIMLFAACGKECDCNTIDKAKKDGETLYQICSYIVDNNLIAEPADPCEFSIREIRNDTVSGKQIYRIMLDCCYLGDQILIDKESNTIIGYLPGDE